jgi:hypothetical protein
MLHALQLWLGTTPPAPFVRDVVWVKAVLESAHILADGLILFCVGVMCARLAGPSPTGAGAAEAARQLGPWVWSGLAVAVATGVVLLSGAGRRGLDNPMFAIKLAAMAAAVLVTAGLQLTLTRTAGFWDASRARQAAATAIGPLCFLLWLATVFAGRLLAYSSAFFAPQY